MTGTTAGGDEGALPRFDFAFWRSTPGFILAAGFALLLHTSSWIASSQHASDDPFPIASGKYAAAATWAALHLPGVTKKNAPVVTKWLDCQQEVAATEEGREKNRRLTDTDVESRQ